MRYTHSITPVCTLAAFLSLISTTVAHAQSAPDIEDAIMRQDQIVDALRNSQDQTTQGAVADEGLAGEAGVYVLKVNDIFVLASSVGSGYSENPQRISNGIGGSGFTTAAATAGIQTRLGETVDFGLRAGLSGVEYSDTQAPSSRSTMGTMNLGMPIAQTPFYANATFFGGYSFDKDFKNDVLFYGSALSVSGGFQLGERTILRPGIGVTRQWSKISENDSSSVSASVSVLHAVLPRFTVSADAQISRVWFDDFYEDVIYTSRRDWQYSASVSANYAFTDWLLLSGSVGYERRTSTFFLTTYQGLEASLALSGRYHF